MKCLKMVLFTLTLVVALSAQVDTNSQNFYMYSYFMHANNGEKLGARLAFSSDGTNWEPYKNGAPVIVPIIAKGADPLMRDPNIYYDSTTGVFHLTWTTAWFQDNIGYSTSKDLINWEKQVMIPVGEKIPGAACCWAPEFFYDDIKDSVMVHWSTERGTIGKEAFCSMTKDFRYFTTPRVYFAPRKDGEVYNVIDESIVKVAENKYYMFFKDERTVTVAGVKSLNIHFVFGPTPQGPWWKGPWHEVSSPITSPGTEGPTACIIGDELRVYFDPYNDLENTDRMRKIKVADLLGADAPASSSWSGKDEVMKTGSGLFLPAHGSISKIPKAKVMQILYGIPDTKVYTKKWKHPKQEQIFVGEVANYTPVPDDDEDTTVVREYPIGKQNTGCGTGFGLAFLPPIAFKAMSFRKRRKQKNIVK